MTNDEPQRIPPPALWKAFTDLTPEAFSYWLAAVNDDGESGELISDDWDAAAAIPAGWDAE